METKNEPVIPEEIIQGKIYLVRGVKVMLDSDLAKLYVVTTGNLNKAVKRNIHKFPKHFMSQLSDKEIDMLVSQNAIPSRKHLGGSLPYGFTEYGILQLANVLRSEQATILSIRIIEVFVKMRELMLMNEELFNKMEAIEQKDIEQDEKIVLTFEYLKPMEQAKHDEELYQDRPRIGYRQSVEKKN